ncbi:hypothetical protein [uncultured Thiodictyon sp.]|jgi:hypothetical protein|uniref:hypothetical protein n=1 Tax=uncultured Thiodictyon sp. TaxID=1846217 RepID=UPI0025F7873F|nr:hypothetical protein [uncultured Thiodictyon sp.]
MTHADAVAAIRQFLRHPTVASDAALPLDALRLHERFQITYWDASIITAARALIAGCCIRRTLTTAGPGQGEGDQSLSGRKDNVTGSALLTRLFRRCRNQGRRS